MKDGDFVFTETLGIARYIARRGGRPDLLGNNPRDEAIMDNFMYAFDDLFLPIIGMFFNKKIMDIKAGHYYKIKSTLERFEKFIGEKDFVIGYITIADFFLAEYSHYI
jgi:glutathione S-transferase